MKVGRGLSVLPRGGGRRRSPPGLGWRSRWRTPLLISSHRFFSISSFYLFHVCPWASPPSLPPSSSRLSHPSHAFEVFLPQHRLESPKCARLNPTVRMRKWSISENPHSMSVSICRSSALRTHRFCRWSSFSLRISSGPLKLFLPLRLFLGAAAS